MWAEMKWPGWEARRGRSSRIEEERSIGVDSSGLQGIFDDSFWAVEDVKVDSVLGIGIWVAWKPLSGGESTICVVELKYRARLGRRKVGGRVLGLIWISRRHRFSVRFIILGGV